MAVPTLLTLALGGGLMRVLYPGYVLAIALWLSARHRPLYVAFVLATFAFSPFLRRLADYGAGFSEFNLILVAPYVGLLPTLPALLHVTTDSRSPLRWPVTVVLACVAYAALLALYQLTIVPTAYEALRWLMPTALCCFITSRPEQGQQVRRCVVAALCTIIPILSVYGVYQFVRAPLWDVYWMWNIDNPTFGQAAAYKIRVFSMMNSPGSVGVFSAYALIILAGESPACMLVAASGLPLLGLTLIRTAWLAFAAGLAVVLVRVTPIRRMSLLAGCVAIAGAASAVITSPALPSEIRNLINDRVSTFSSLGSDASTYDRLRVYDAFYDRLADSPWGEGFGANASTATKYERRRSTVAIDSGVLETYLIFGVFGGTFYFLAFASVIMAAWQACKSLNGPLAGNFAVGCAVVVILPLGTNHVGESGVLLWTALGVLLACADASRPGSAATGAPPPPSRVTVRSTTGLATRNMRWIGRSTAS